MRFFLYSNQHFLPPASCCKSWFIHFEQGESLLIILSIPWTQRYAACSVQSELFFHLLLKNTVRRVQKHELKGSFGRYGAHQFSKLLQKCDLSFHIDCTTSEEDTLQRHGHLALIPANKGIQTLSKLGKRLASWSSRVFRFFKQACSLDTIQELPNLEWHLKWGIDLPHHHRCSL